MATLAGGNWSGATGALLDAAAVTATAVNISALGAVALDSDRSFVYYIEAAQAVVHCIDVPQGALVTTLAGVWGRPGFDGDGPLPATSQRLSSPTMLAVDSAAGNVYILDAGVSRIRSVSDATGMLQTVASGGFSTADRVAATSANQTGVRSIATAPSHERLYIFEDVSCKLRCIDLANSTVTTIGGTGTCGLSLLCQWQSRRFNCYQNSFTTPFKRRPWATMGENWLTLILYQDGIEPRLK